jgi:hypothetical protein
MGNPLFSTYHQDENRVTASILAVLERISFALVEQILQALTQEPEAQLVTFQNQPVGPSSVPDARIHASFSYWIETKIEPGAVRKTQIEAHLRALDRETNVGIKRLLALTPDETKPNAVEAIDDPRVVWVSFQDLVTAIQQALESDENWITSERYLPTERERDLLRELIHFLISKNLVGLPAEQVIVVAARIALQEYLQYGCYFCQPNRTFQPSTHLAFYVNGCIHRQIPAILGSVESVTLTEQGVEQCDALDEDQKRELLDIVRRLTEVGNSRVGQQEKVIFLTDADSDDTIQLSQHIENDLKADSGRPTSHRTVDRMRS